MAAKKKDAAPPKPWEIAPFTTSFAFIGDHMLTAHALDNEVREWDTAVGIVLKGWRKGRAMKKSIGAIAVRPGARQFLVENDDQLLLWDEGKPKPVREIGAVRVRSLAWLDDRHFVSGDYAGMLRVWDIETGKALREMEHGDQVIALATDGKIAWGGGWDEMKSISRWDTSTGKSIGKITLDAACSSMDRSPDGARLACLAGGMLHVFDWASGKELAKVKAHARAESCAWTGDGEHLVTCSEFDNTLRLWSASCKALATRDDLPRPARLATGPDGVVYVSIAYKRIDRFRVAKDAFVAI